MKKEDHGYVGYYLHQLQIKRDECCHGKVTMDNTAFHALSSQIQYPPETMVFIVKKIEWTHYIICKCSNNINCISSFCLRYHQCNLSVEGGKHQISRLRQPRVSDNWIISKREQSEIIKVRLRHSRLTASANLPIFNKGSVNYYLTPDVCISTDVIHVEELLSEFLPTQRIF